MVSVVKNNLFATFTQSIQSSLIFETTCLLDLLVMACKFYDKWSQDIEMLDIIYIFIEQDNCVPVMLFSL